MFPKSLNEVVEEIKKLKYVSEKTKPIIEINTEERKVVVSNVHVESSFETEEENYRAAGTVAVDMFELFLGGAYHKHQYIQLFEGYSMEVRIENQKGNSYLFTSLEDRYEYFDAGLGY